MRRELGPEDGVERGVEDQDGVALGERDGGAVGVGVGARGRWTPNKSAAQEGVVAAHAPDKKLCFKRLFNDVNMPFLFVSISKLDGVAYPINSQRLADNKKARVCKKSTCIR